jgi:hypothetical protein
MEYNVVQVLAPIPKRETMWVWRVRARRFFFLALALIATSFLYASCSSAPPAYPVVTPTNTVKPVPTPVYKITISTSNNSSSPKIIYATRWSWNAEGTILYYVDINGIETWFVKAVGESVDIKQIIP